MVSSYPADDLDRPSAIAALSGSFWTEINEDRREFAGATAGIRAAWRRQADAWAEAAAAVALDAVPLRAVVEWTPLVVLESEVSAAGRPRRFGVAGAFGAAGSFGDRVPGPAAASIAPFDSAPAILDGPGRAGVVWTAGTDYVVADSTVEFRVDPFADPAWRPEPVLDASGAVVDRTLVLWLWRAGRDDRLLDRRVGGILGMELPSTPTAAALVSTALDVFATGGSRATFRRLVAAALDVPLCSGDEVVEAVVRDAVGTVVVTDAAAYRLPPRAVATVAPGDRLRAGDPLCDAVRFDPLGPAVPEGLTAFAPPAGLCPGLVRGPTPTFVAGAVPVEFEGPPTPLRARWRTGADDAGFWRSVRAREDAGGVTVADFLAGTAGATRGDVPATIDPLRSLFGDCLRGGGTLVRVRPAASGPAAVRADDLIRLLSRPEHAIVALSEAEPVGTGFAPRGGDDASGGIVATAAPATSESPTPDGAWDAAFGRTPAG